MSNIYECPECGEECEVQGDTLEELEVFCPKCDLDFTELYYNDIAADWISDRADRAMDEMKDREMGL